MLAHLRPTIHVSPLQVRKDLYLSENTTNNSNPTSIRKKLRLGNAPVGGDLDDHPLSGGGIKGNPFIHLLSDSNKRSGDSVNGKRSKNNTTLVPGLFIMTKHNDLYSCRYIESVKPFGRSFGNYPLSELQGVPGNISKYIEEYQKVRNTKQKFSDFFRDQLNAVVNSLEETTFPAVSSHRNDTFIKR